MTTYSDLPAANPAEMTRLLTAAEESFAHWEILKDVVDELIDLMLNTRQSGHPGGSRSKVHLLLATMLSGAMRWDLRRPWRPLQDRFVLGAGHTVPVVYAALAVLNESLALRHHRDNDDRFAFPDDGRWALRAHHLTGLRHRGGLAGHAEMEGRTLFLKFNTGPSGHGFPAAAGEAAALMLAGLGDVKVFCLEGEGGLTPGSTHETKNSAYGLGLANLVALVDWNDYGIDTRPASSVVHGSPEDWFGSAGWRVTGTMDGMSWGPVTSVVLDAARGSNPASAPTAAWVRTIKGRGYGKVDAASHGSPWPINSPQFWAGRRRFMQTYGVRYQGVDAAAPAGPKERIEQLQANLDVALSVLARDDELVTYLSDRLLEIAATVPDRSPRFRLDDGGRPQAVFSDPAILDPRSYPASLWKAPGEKVANRAGLAAWSSYVNSVSRKRHGRPLFIACSADLAESTGIAGFANGWEDTEGWGWFDRTANQTGTVLPQEITEFTNAAMMAGLASVNLADDPFADFNGFWTACSTYGAFTYLKYGPLRLFSQLAQDSQLRVGKLLYVAGHSGPETAEDSRTHFGIYEPGMTQLFPAGHVIDLHPWEYNEVPVVLAAALALDVAIIALHLTRPAVVIPDRAQLGIASHHDAARGAYLIRDYQDGQRDGAVVVRGSLNTETVISLLPELDDQGLNLRIVAAISPQLFALQDAAYRDSVLSAADTWNAMMVTNGAVRFMSDWFNGPNAIAYSLSPDWDDRWRTGGAVAEVMDEAHLSRHHVMQAIRRFTDEREARQRSIPDAFRY